MNGEGFVAHVKEGDQVKVGDPLRPIKDKPAPINEKTLAFIKSLSIMHTVIAPIIIAVNIAPCPRWKTTYVSCS